MRPDLRAHLTPVQSLLPMLPPKCSKRLRVLLTLPLAFLLALPLREGGAQRPDGATLADSAVSAGRLDSLAIAHLAVAAFRGQLQAELAEPKSKKPEVQAALRAKLRAGTLRLLNGYGFTESEFARLTKRVSSDDALRRTFEQALARLSGPKGPT